MPTSLALLGAAGASEPSPSASAGAAWATSQLTFNAGPYESVKSGFADYGRPGETEAQLRARVNAVVLSDVEFHVRAIRDLHTKLGDATSRTLSAPRPGAPSGAPAASSPPLNALVHDIRLELSDASPIRLSCKEKVWTDWLQRRGYTSLQDVRVGDEWGLGKVLDEFEAINARV
ncbi:MAG: hypothetical protein JRM86_04185 [Nitrososphaerota archaeon]|nr:hypothetical protein [Nitrososphaerota archaeon]